MGNCVKNKKEICVIQVVKRLRSGISRPGVYPWVFLVGVYRPVLRIPTLLQNKKCYFSHSFLNLASKIHARFQAWRWSQNATYMFTLTGITGVLIISLRKALDVVDYKLLLKKTQVYGFNARMLTPSNGSKVILAEDIIVN